MGLPLDFAGAVAMVQRFEFRETKPSSPFGSRTPALGPRPGAHWGVFTTVSVMARPCSRTHPQTAPHTTPALAEAWNWRREGRGCAKTPNKFREVFALDCSGAPSTRLVRAARAGRDSALGAPRRASSRLSRRAPRAQPDPVTWRRARSPGADPEGRAPGGKGWCGGGGPGRGGPEGRPEHRDSLRNRADPGSQSPARLSPPAAPAPSAPSGPHDQPVSTQLGLAARPSPARRLLPAPRPCVLRTCRVSPSQRPPCPPGNLRSPGCGGGELDVPAAPGMPHEPLRAAPAPCRLSLQVPGPAPRTAGLGSEERGLSDSTCGAQWP